MGWRKRQNVTEELSNLITTVLPTKLVKPCLNKLLGRQTDFPHLYNVNPRSTERRKHQVTCPPIGNTVLGKPLNGINIYTSPYFHSRNGFHTIHSENSPVKPKIVTVVKPGNHPPKKITLLLNRRSVQTFEQLIADISEALGFPRWKNDRVRKLYNLKGKEIRSVSDFFRADDTFIALGKEPLTLKCIETVFRELYPDVTLRQNTDHYEKLKYKLNDKGQTVDSGYEDTDLANKCRDAASPTLTHKHGKEHIKQKTEATKKTKKHEKVKRSQEYLSGKMKKLDLCHCKPGKTITASWDYAAHCESSKEYKLKHRLYTEFENDTLLNVDTLKELCIKLPVCGNCKSGKLTLKCKNCHHKCKEFKTDFNEAEETMHSSMEQYETMYCPHSRIHNENHDMHRNQHLNSKHQRERSKWCREHSNSKTVKHSKRLIEDFLEDTKKNIQIKDRAVVDNESNSKKDIVSNIDSKEQNGDGGLPGKENEKDVFRFYRSCSMKNHLDIERDYEIGRTIGDGNFAVVKECKFLKTCQEYAMKIVNKDKLIGKEDIVKNEVRIIRMLSHPNIVKFIDHFETEKEIYLILEYIKGGDLFDAITKSIKFTEHDAALMLTDLCKALVYIHSKNIVHRDLKPENLLVQHNLDGSKTLKLADFGLAVHVAAPIFTVCGTPTYVAPEILSEKGYGLEVDLWATGVILYVLLCGFPPFRSPERNHEELFQIIQHGEYEFLSPYWNNISDEAKDLISRLLVLSPLERLTARSVLKHKWVRSSRQMNSRNLQREVTMNIERHFRNRLWKQGTNSEL
ncbi:serine/threonine-protein kinase DCLK3 [Hyperolius riggenbachi]|uniref:serine/threonine-protein kinase DCLK3 n=1 Tax=Hyperolius riggenbachi TaxID=752182 RepID=UPI0035A2B6CB